GCDQTRSYSSWRSTLTKSAHTGRNVSSPLPYVQRMFLGRAHCIPVKLGVTFIGESVVSIINCRSDSARRDLVMERVGRRFAYRDHPRRRGAPVEPVEVVREGPDGTRKVLIRFLTGEREGHEKWVPAGRLLVPWEEVEAFFRDEQLMLAALEASGGVFETPHYEAAGWVFTAMAERWGDELVYCGYNVSEGGLVIIEDFDYAVPRIGGLHRPE